MAYLCGFRGISPLRLKCFASANTHHFVPSRPHISTHFQRLQPLFGIWHQFFSKKITPERRWTDFSRILGPGARAQVVCCKSSGKWDFFPAAGKKVGEKGQKCRFDSLFRAVRLKTGRLRPLRVSVSGKAPHLPFNRWWKVAGFFRSAPLPQAFRPDNAASARKRAPPPS